jgi:lycopene cyclase domain-containing protein
MILSQNWFLSEYFLVLVACLSLPLILSFFPASNMHKYYRQIFQAIFLVLPSWIIWDIFATFRGHWGFHPNYIFGPKFINLPLEEVAFFIVIPYCCLFIWVLIKERIKPDF